MGSSVAWRWRIYDGHNGDILSNGLCAKSPDMSECAFQADNLLPVPEALDLCNEVQRFQIASICNDKEVPPGNRYPPTSASYPPSSPIFTNIKLHCLSVGISWSSVKNEELFDLKAVNKIGNTHGVMDMKFQGCSPRTRWNKHKAL